MGADNGILEDIKRLSKLAAHADPGDLKAAIDELAHKIEEKDRNL